MKTILSLFFVLIIARAEFDNEIDCKISTVYAKNQSKPLILTYTSNPTFVLPDENRFVRVTRNTSILLACPGSGFVNFKSQNLVKATCVSGGKFLIDSKVQEIDGVNCSKPIKEVVKKNNAGCLNGRAARYDIGFSLNQSYFLPLMEICRNDSSYETFYTHGSIVKEIRSYQEKVARPFWKAGAHYRGFNVNAAYKVQSEVVSFAQLLGSKELADRYVKPKTNFYLNRGHLMAKADFVYAAQQVATFWLLNTAPQWASVNAGNWLSVEMAVREYSSRNGLDLDVYTGVHGQMSLEDVNGEQQPVYLHTNGSRRIMAVPRFFWKVVHDRAGNRATAFVSVNDPYLSNATETGAYLCGDRSSESFSWLGWRADNVTAGLSYVCSVPELREKVPTIPDLGDIGLLV
ncbi:uncharacterized protein LOC111693613 [Trichogramma pretiosum]|uniref:uncharacterized protein LOC111693613 n=1 Tax=Trichogramma pretiosum TaxID=7493 RepID=UPI000C71BAC6|nr:uncharacterized protein LOC111693613 [Trichogramma pretiosum]